MKKKKKRKRLESFLGDKNRSPAPTKALARPLPAIAAGCHGRMNAMDAPLFPPPPPPMAQIFLSHSGQQKGFASDLRNRLSSLTYSVFFDQDHHSLPPGQPFPDLIFSAANTCKIAVIVLSPDFLTSRWPMLELCAFMDRYLRSTQLQQQAHHGSAANDSFTILPLFFELSPADIKANEKVEEWRKAWQRFEKEDRRGRIKADRCEGAVTKWLPKFNGIERRPKTEQGEASYIDEVAKGILHILPIPSIHVRDKLYSGIDRLCKIIVDKFRELEATHSATSFDACVLGMYGVPGSGKSTLCTFLCESMSQEFRGNVMLFEFPPSFDHLRVSSDYLLLTDKYRGFLDKFISYGDIRHMDQSKVCSLLNGTRSSHKMFLVFDNITPANYESYKTVVHTILSSPIVGSGSKILLVARSLALVKDLLKPASYRQRYAIGDIDIPLLTKHEAMEIIKYRCQCPLVKEDLIARLLGKSNCQLSTSMYIPFVFEQIGVLLGNRHTDVEEELLEIVNEGKKDAVQELIDANFKNLKGELQFLFLDTALFIIPAGYSKVDDAAPILSRMHGTSSTFQVTKKITDLQKQCFLSIIEDRLRVHDIFTEYAKNIPSSSMSYFNYIEPLPSILDSGRSSMDLTMVQLKCPDARTINIDAFRGFHVELGAKAKALIVRNNSHYRKCIVSLSGDWSSLASMKMVNVQRILFAPSGSSCTDLANLVRLELMDVTSNLVNRSRTWMSKCMDIIVHVGQNMMCLLGPLFAWEVLCRPATYDSLESRLGNAGRMSRLQVLKLVNAHIQRLEDIGRYFPELEDLEVLDDRTSAVNEHQILSIGKARKLKRIAIGLSFDSWKRGTEFFYGHYGIMLKPSKSPRLVLQLDECPNLQQFCVDERLFASVEVVSSFPSMLRYVAIANRMSRDLMLTILITPRNQLSLLQVLELHCKMVECLDFSRGSLPSLERLQLVGCDRLTHLSMDPSCLPKLRNLKLVECHKLQVFEGLASVVAQLRKLKLHHLSQLQCDVRCANGGDTCVQLEDMDVFFCEGVKIHQCLLEASARLKSLKLSQTCIALPSGKQLHTLNAIVTSMGNHLQFLEDLTLIRISVLRMMDQEDRFSTFVDGLHTISTEEEGLVCSDIPPDRQMIQAAATSNARAPNNRLTFLKGQFTGLNHLTIDGTYLPQLQEIEEIQHLHNLGSLSLQNHPNLSRVSSVWPTSIQCISLVACPVLQEIPRLDDTPELYDLSCEGCVELKAVEVCIHQMRKLMNGERCKFSFVGCESMTAFPMEEVMDELGQRRKEYPVRLYLYPPVLKRRLRVRGSKFASVEEMRRWLARAELGSLLFEAATEALVWALLKDGASDASDALLHHFSSLVETLDDADLEYLRRLFGTSRSIWYNFTRVEYFMIQIFRDWLRMKLPQLHRQLFL